MYVFSIYAPHSVKCDEAKENFCNFIFQIVSEISVYEMVVSASNMNGYVGRINIGYAGVHGGFGYGIRNADGSRIPEFTDSLCLVTRNTCFTKQDSQLVSYKLGPN